MENYLPTFDELSNLFKENAYHVLSWQNELQPGNVGYSNIRNPGPNNIIESRDQYRSDANAIYLTVMGYAGTGAHITIRKDTWDSHKLIHVTIYVYIYTMDTRRPNQYVVSECSKYYIVSLIDNQVNISPIRTEVGEFDARTLNESPPYVKSNKIPCDYMRNMDTIQNGILYRYQVGTKTYMAGVIYDQLLKSFREFIDTQVKIKRHAELIRRKMEEMKRQKEIKQQPEQQLKRERDEETQEEKAILQSEQTGQTEAKKTKQDPGPFSGGSINYKHKYLKYKMKYMKLKN